MSEKNRTLYCSNLSEKVTERILYELFMQAGPVIEVRIPKQRNIGFVIFKHECSVLYAAKLMENTMLYGKCLIARPVNGSCHSTERPSNQERLDLLNGSSLRGLSRDIRKRPQDNDMLPNVGKRNCRTYDPVNNFLNRAAPCNSTHTFFNGPLDNNFPLENNPCIQYPSQNTEFRGSFTHQEDIKYHDQNRDRDWYNDRSFRREDRYNDFEHDKYRNDRYMYKEKRHYGQERGRYDKHYNKQYSRGNNRHNERSYDFRGHKQ